ncbi:Capz-Interacting Protein [Manis pentadactyla]|nr:Capz-Interacting Protein [Manis pentadactyla]
MLSQRPVLSASSPLASRAPSSPSASRGWRRQGLRYRGPTTALCLREFPTQTQAKRQSSPFARLGKPPGRKRQRRPGALGWDPGKFSSKPLVRQLKRGPSEVLGRIKNCCVELLYLLSGISFHSYSCILKASPTFTDDVEGGGGTAESASEPQKGYHEIHSWAEKKAERRNTSQV